MKKLMLLLIVLLVPTFAAADNPPPTRMPPARWLAALIYRDVRMTPDMAVELKAMLAEQIQQRTEIQQSLVKDIQQFGFNSPQAEDARNQRESFDLSIDTLRNRLTQAAIPKLPKPWFNLQNDSSLLLTLALTPVAIFYLIRATRFRRSAFLFLKAYVIVVVLMIITDQVHIWWTLRSRVPSTLWTFVAIIALFPITLGWIGLRAIGKKQGKDELLKLRAMDIS